MAYSNDYNYGVDGADPLAARVRRRIRQQQYEPQGGTTTPDPMGEVDPVQAPTTPSPYGSGGGVNPNSGTVEPAPTSPYDNETENDPTGAGTIINWYKTYLGRDPRYDEISVHQKNPGGWRASENVIKNSAEAKKYAAWLAANPGGQDQIPEDTNPTAPVKPGAYANMLQGFDSGKLNDPKHQTIKYQFARIAQDYEPTPAGLEAMAKDPRFAAAGFTFVGKDKIKTSEGEVVDVGLSFGSGGGKGWWWGSDAPADGAAAGSGTSTNPAMPTDGGTAWSNAGGSGGGNQLWDTIRNLLGQGQINPLTDPVLQAQQKAYDLQAQRGSDRLQATIAERMAANGNLDSGGFDTAVQAAEQQSNEQAASQFSEAAASRLTQQREEIMNALNIGAGMYSAEEQRALTERLGMIDANLRLLSINNQNTQYNNGLGWDMAQFQWLQNLLPYLTK